MIKHYLSLCTFASTLTLLSGCIIVSGGTDSDTDSTTNGTTTAGSTSDGSTSDGSTSDGSTTDASTSIADGTATADTLESTTAAPETSSTTDDTTTAAPGGGCGWNPSEMYYDCGPNGVPGEADPEGEPLNCPEDQKLEDGQPCGAISNLGCCDANGDLWFCEEGELFGQICE